MGDILAGAIVKGMIWQGLFQQIAVSILENIEITRNRQALAWMLV